MKNPHLWAGAGTLVGGLANMAASGYRLSEFRLRFNSWESERTAFREQGADMVQHFVLGYSLTRFFLSNDMRPIPSAVSAFAYEFIAGEVFESFPQAGGISWRDIGVDVVAVAVGALDHDGRSPIRFRAASRTDVRASLPNEFDPYYFSLGVAVGRLAGMEIVCSVQSWKTPIQPPQERDRGPVPGTAYYLANH